MTIKTKRFAHDRFSEVREKTGKYSHFSVVWLIFDLVNNIYR
jgi:hypothetical protein